MAGILEAVEYLGKILGTDYTGKPAPALAAIAADPRGETIRHGPITESTKLLSCGWIGRAEITRQPRF